MDGTTTMHHEEDDDDGIRYSDNKIARSSRLAIYSCQHTGDLSRGSDEAIAHELATNIGRLPTKAARLHLEP